MSRNLLERLVRSSVKGANCRLMTVSCKAKNCLLYHRIRPILGNTQPHVGCEDLSAMVMKVVIFWDIAPCSSFMKQCLEEIYHLHLQGRKSAEYETSLFSRWLACLVLILTTRRCIPEDENFHAASSHMHTEGYFLGKVSAWAWNWRFASVQCRH
jgi:hypothetical protein